MPPGFRELGGYGAAEVMKTLLADHTEVEDRVALTRRQRWDKEGQGVVS